MVFLKYNISVKTFRENLNIKDIFSDYVAPEVELAIRHFDTCWKKDTTNLLEGLEIGGLVERDCRD